MALSPPRGPSEKDSSVDVLQRKRKAKFLWSKVVGTIPIHTVHLDECEPTSKTRLSTNTLEINSDELQLLRQIGSGGFGVIHKAFWRGTVVACKTIRTDMFAEEQLAALEDLHLEVQVLQQLRHPNIMMLLAYEANSEHQVMVSELMACSLLDILKTGSVADDKPALNRKFAVRYAVQLSQGMNYLHTCKPPIMHRDLKPENLLLDYSGIIKVADFGLAKLRPGPTPEADPNKVMMTGETGSYRFMAPEVYRHEAYDESVDVYSFSMIFFYMLRGQPPFLSMDGVQAAKAAAIEKARPNIPTSDTFAPPLAELLRTTWCDVPSERLTFQQVLAQLRSYYKETWHCWLEDDMAKETKAMVAAMTKEDAASGCCSVL